ncbi:MULTISPECIES: dTDP-4-dehydrorhamnose reductase [Bradyrhizobium]|jgi:dTDP-4-dehydrorhamnose reductase|uniref:dTDP-4-dehydrorhamnose reductase n=1 Tax=Bradyrhizobium TaxID=374 RepID=UPI0004ACFF75|nr:dTDP-4-dehydrorhamnose reductase [Bradyrhizobium elkanii]MCS3524548.1 dTDP-4-dehydrorhamnose reductase [Bradyrhizobium elkanii]MCS4072203.1 dTDP-4-dehydrorhamnose reductase [Bradyrhizobium elkanii]MCS4078837.1 dTDP-4-dehydrorhamnose reductase [Bradyrhizobium elkanii]MCW2122565.1 dTDP-4-dehydrorhamnose reductase [Bradyrhizobium elkanii]MCW2169312.1 dTDP-4-dehydrorhamnose reductase [Bradyrhizobium elkanii]
MRILVTGRNGQIAQALVRLATSELVIEAFGRPELDITDRISIDRAIGRFRPDILVNAAAYTAVDKAESDVEAAFAANRDGAGNVAAAAAAVNIPVIHLSTDYIFPGEGGVPYREEDAAGPINLYGRSKLEGEHVVTAVNPWHVILRTSWVYAPWGQNFPKVMLRLASERDAVRVVADQHGAPTYAPDIAEGILRVARAALVELSSSAWRGVFHMTAAGETSWAGFAEAIFAESAKCGGPSARVESIVTTDYPTPARRPLNSRLDNSRFNAIFDYSLPDWRDGVRRCVEELTAISNPLSEKH